MIGPVMAGLGGSEQGGGRTPPRWPWRGFVPAVVILALVPVTGCGAGPEASEPGGLAAMVPADAGAYGELVARPGGDLREDLEQLVVDFGGDPERDLALGGDLTAEASDTLASGESLDYDEDVADWLGYRVGGFLRFGSSDELIDAALPEGGFGSGAYSGAALLEVTDDEAAAETLTELAGASDDLGEDELYRLNGAATVVLVPGTMLLGEPEAVEDALTAARTGRTLADEDWFEEGLAAVQESALGFVVGDVETVGNLQFINDSPRFAERYLDRFSELQGPGLYGTSVFQVTVQPSGPAFDIAYSVDEPVDLRAAERGVAALPGDSWLALGDVLVTPVLLDSFELGLEIGFEQENATRSDVFASFGYDPRDSLARLARSSAVFARGAPADLQAGLMLDVLPGRGPGFPVDAARFVIGTEPGAKIPRRPLRYGGPFGFSASLPAVPEKILATEATNRLGVIVGAEESELPEVFEPDETLAGSEQLANTREALGAEWTPLGFADLEPLIEILEAVDPSALSAPSPALPEGTMALFGARNRTGFVEQRFMLDLRP